MPSRARRSAAPSVGTTSTSPRQVRQRQPVEEAALVEAGVGQEAAGVVGDVLQRARHVLTGEQARHPDVAPEEVVGDGVQRNVLTWVGGHERPEHPGARRCRSGS